MSTTHFLLASVLFVCCPAAQGDLPSLLAELESRGEDAEPELIQAVAGRKTRPAMQALLAFYDRVATTYVRREIVRVLSTFDGVAEAEEPALEKLANVATTAEERELREAAVQALGECDHLGKHFLSAIVDSPAHNEVREMAIRLHVKRAEAADAEWYRGIWKRNELRRKAKEEGPPELETVREAAFSGLAKHLEDDELAKALKEVNPRIRRAALTELDERKSPLLKPLATKLFQRVDVAGTDRALAAEILAAMNGPRMVAEFLKLAKKKAVTPNDLRQSMALLLVGMNDAKANKKLASLVGRGQPHEKVFALLATVHLADPKLVKRIRKGLKDKDFSVRRATARVLAERGDKESLAGLEKMLAKPRDPGDVRVAIEAMGTIRGDEAQWIGRLVEMAGHKDRDVRNAVLEQLARTGDAAHMSILLGALGHQDWATRLVAIKSFEALSDKQAVPALIERLPLEQGRMETAVADALWSLTGMPFEKDAGQWKSWWQDKGGAVRRALIRGPGQGPRVSARFAGCVSGPWWPRRPSSSESGSSRTARFSSSTPRGRWSRSCPGRKIGNRDATRIEVAKEELQQCIMALEQQALFNVIAFSSGVARWLESGIGAASGNTREAAAEYVGRLGAGGATNLYGRLEGGVRRPRRRHDLRALRR